MPFSSAYNHSVSWDANTTSINAASLVNPAAFDPSAWPAHDMIEGLDLPTFDLYVKCVLVDSATTSGLLGVPEQQVYVGNGRSFNVLRHSALAIRKRAAEVEFQGSSCVPCKKLKPFIQELLVLHHPHLQKEKVIIGLVGFSWDIELGSSDMLTVVSPALELEFAQHGNLAQYLKSKPLSQSLSERRMLCHQVLAGLSCLHSYHIVHGDLKLENILVCSSEADSGVVAKLSDFGFSIFATDIDSTPVNLPGGSQPWNSPEWRECQASKEFYKSDMYSVGLIVWASFSLGEDPFNREGHNGFAEPELLPSDSRDQRLFKIANLKTSDKVLEIACRTTEVTLASVKKGSRSLYKTYLSGTSNAELSLLTALKTVYENTLQLNPALRSLQPAIKALESDSSSIAIKQSNIESLTLWGALYFSPRQVSPKTFQLGLLRGGQYPFIPGAPMVARLSVAISKHIFQNTESFTLERRRDAAFFLFRSYYESYGVEENQQNMEQAIQWLHEFTKLGMISGTEDLCFAIAEFSKRIGHDLPLEFPLESSLRTGLQSILRGGLYIKSIAEDLAQCFPNLFNGVLSSFKEEGLRRFLPEQFRSNSLSSVLPLIGLDKNTVEAVALMHVAASCGDIHTASLLVENHSIDLNARANFWDITPIVTALKFSQSDFVLWLLSQGASAKFQDQRMPVLCFLSNFDTDNASAICNALCQAGASVNDTWYFDYRFARMDMLSFAILAFDLATIDLLLAQQPSVVTCQNALRWACANGRLDVLMKIESYLSRVLESPPGKSDWELGFSNITFMSPYYKLTFPHRPDFVETAKYIIEKIGGELTPKTLYSWMKMAITVGDSESLRLCLKQAGSSQFLRRSQPLKEKQGRFLEKSGLEWAIVMDRKELFDIFIEMGSPIELEQAEGNFPTLLHSAAQRDTLNGKYFCKTLLAKGDNLEAEASRSLRGVTAFEVAMRYNNYEVADLLLQQGASIDALDDEGPTPLGELINVHSRNALAGMKFLLEHPKGKPSFTVYRAGGRTALHLASGPDYTHDWQYLEDVDGHEAILDLILEHYNEPRHLNARDKCGFTALHYATYRGCDWAVEKLLKAGADPNLYSCMGIRPVDCANQSRALSLALQLASTNFNVSSPSSETRRAAARLRCLKLLNATGARDLGDAVGDLGLRKFLMGSFGLINNAREDHEVYEPWIGEFPLNSVSKWLTSRRNKRSQAKLQQRQNSGE